MRPRSTPHPRPAPPHAQHVNLNRSFSSEGGAAPPQVRSYLGHPSAPSRQESRGRSGSRRRRTRAREPGARIARAMQSEPPDATRSDAGGWAALIGRRPGSPQGMGPSCGRSFPSHNAAGSRLRRLHRDRPWPPTPPTAPTAPTAEKTPRWSRFPRSPTPRGPLWAE